MRVGTAGRYSGVGIEVSAQDGRDRGRRPIEGSPAARAGVRAGDVILAVDDAPVTPGQLEETIGACVARRARSVRLAVGRDGEPEPLQFDLERSRGARAHGACRAAAGRLRLRPHHAVQRFDAGRSRKRARRALEAEPAAGAPLRGIVLDLRGNPGGVLESAVSVADEFLDAA